MRLSWKNYGLVGIGAWVFQWLAVLALRDGLTADEPRYLAQAGHWLESGNLFPHDDISNGPLWPLMLAGLIRAGVSEPLLEVISVLMLSLAAMFLLSVLARYARLPLAMLLAMILPLYPPLLLLLAGSVMTEIPVLLLSCLVLLIVHRLVDSAGRSVLATGLLALIFGALALIKPIFGYVLPVMLVLSLIGVLVFRRESRRVLVRLAFACLAGLLLCIPWLNHTYQLTGKQFVWATEAGTHLYFMSIGGEDVWGSWVSDQKVPDNEFLLENGYADVLLAAQAMSGPERNEYLSALAIERIKADPGTYLTNVVANIGRVLFNYPYSFRAQSLFTYGFLLPNMALYLTLAVTFLLLPWTWRQQHLAVTWLFVFYMVFLGGNFPVGSTARQGMVALPAILMWLTCQFRLLSDRGVVNINNLARNQAQRSG